MSRHGRRDERLIEQQVVVVLEVGCCCCWQCWLVVSGCGVHERGDEFGEREKTLEIGADELGESLLACARRVGDEQAGGGEHARRIEHSETMLGETQGGVDPGSSACELAEAEELREQSEKVIGVNAGHVPVERGQHDQLPVEDLLDLDGAGRVLGQSRGG